MAPPGAGVTAMKTLIWGLTALLAAGWTGLVWITHQLTGWLLGAVDAGTLKDAGGAVAGLPVPPLPEWLNLWIDTAWLGTLQACKELGIAYVAFSPLGRAFLTGKLQEVEGLVKGDIRAAMPRFAPEAYAKNLQLLAPMQSIAERADCTLAELAIAWVLHQGEHVIALPGTTSVDHLHDDLRGGAVRLDAALLAELDDLFKPERIQGDRYAVASQREVDTEKYAFETV